MPEPLFATGVARLTRFLQRHTVALFVVCAAVTALLGFYAFQIRVVPDVYALIPQDEKTPGRAEPGAEREPIEALVLAADSESPYELEKLRLLAEVAQDILELPGMRSSVTPFSMLAFEGDGRRVLPRTLGPSGGAPSTPRSSRRSGRD